jgi:hypothetical protein
VRQFALEADHGYARSNIDGDGPGAQCGDLD